VPCHHTNYSLLSDDVNKSQLFAARGRHCDFDIPSHVHLVVRDLAYKRNARYNGILCLSVRCDPHVKHQLTSFGALFRSKMPPGGIRVRFKRSAHRVCVCVLLHGG